MKQKLIAVLLFLALAASMVSCSGGGSGKSPAATTASGAQSGSTAATTEARISPNLPEKDFGGYVFRVLTKGTTNVHWKSKDIYAEEMNGEALNDAVYERNSKVGEKYNFKMKEIVSTQGTWNLYSDVQLSVQSGSDEYDMVAIGLQTDLKTLASAGMLVDLNTIDYMDLTKPWYDQNANKALSIAGKLHATVGDLTVMDNEATYGILFNKSLASDLGLGSLYDVVYGGQWTMDKMYTYISNVSKDINGDGAHDETDQWGVIGEPFNTYGYIVGAGETIVDKNKDDIPNIRVENEKYYSAFDKAIKINGNFDLCMYANNYTSKYTGDTVWSDCIDKAFSEGRVLFNCAGLVRVTVFRSMDTDFGILPMPKYDEKQEKYCNVVSMGCSNSIAVPMTATNFERTGIIIEALSAESMYTITPAFYDITIKGKATRDVESGKILDMIFDNRIFDLGYVYNWGSLASTIYNLTGTTSPNIASTVASTVSAAKTDMQKTIDAFQKLS